MDGKETPASKATDATALHRVPGTCVLAILQTFLTQEEIILAHTDMCCVLLPKI